MLQEHTYSVAEEWEYKIRAPGRQSNFILDNYSKVIS